jgi:hypothetical protein
MSTTPGKKLDEKGRCCGRKSMVYRGKNTTEAGPHRFCGRCNAAYDLEENEQISNWAYKKTASGKFIQQFGTGVLR